jgi:hypothetical protein
MTYSVFEKSKTIPLNFEVGHSEDGALAFFREQGLEPLARTSLPHGTDCALLFGYSDFDRLKAIFLKR